MATTTAIINESPELDGVAYFNVLIAMQGDSAQIKSCDVDYNNLTAEQQQTVDDFLTLINTLANQ